MLMNTAIFFPSVLIVLDVLSGIIYLSDGDIRKGIYWFAAGILTASVTY